MDELARLRLRILTLEETYKDLGAYVRSLDERIRYLQATKRDA